MPGDRRNEGNVGAAYPVRLSANGDPDLAPGDPAEIVLPHKRTKFTAKVELDRAMFITCWMHVNNPPVNQFAWTDVPHGEQFLASD